MDNEKYEILIEELIDVLRTKNETIFIQKYEIEKLTNKLADCEKELSNKFTDKKLKIEKRNE